MSETPDRPVLLTGASGGLGRVLTRYLAGRGWRLNPFVLNSLNRRSARLDDYRR